MGVPADAALPDAGEAGDGRGRESGDDHRALRALRLDPVAGDFRPFPSAGDDLIPLACRTNLFAGILMTQVGAYTMIL